MRLEDFPRPPQDNGRGLHFTLDLRETDKHPSISTAIENLQEIGCTWTLVYAQDEIQAELACSRIWKAGIMPALRPHSLIDRPRTPDSWLKFVKALTKHDIPPYIQIFNEPGDDRETVGPFNINQYANAFADLATLIYDAGAYPGLQALGADDIHAVLQGLKRRGAERVFDRLWFSLHNYGANHPPAYPYDEVNQKGTQLTAEEYAQYKFSMPFEEINAQRKREAKPGATIFTDDTSIIRHPTYAAAFQEEIGFVPPFIGGEGGWEYGAENDLRYPKVEGELHADWHREIFDCFRTGILPNGEPLPDYLFSMTFWIVFGWGVDDWFGGDPKTLTIEAVKALPPFTRKFSWDATAPSTEPVVITPPPSPAAPTEPSPSAPGTMPAPVGDTTTTPPASATTTYIVQQGETLWGIAKKFGTTVAVLTAANNLDNPNKIRAGQKLIIPR